MGISTAIGIGGDPIIGTTTKDAVELFMNDPETDGIIMIGEIGGQLEVMLLDGLKKMEQNLSLDSLRVKLLPLVEQWVTLVLQLVVLKDTAEVKDDYYYVNVVLEL